MRFRPILIVLVLLNVFWALLSDDDPGADEYASSVGSSTRTVGPGIALLSELPSREVQPVATGAAGLDQPDPIEVSANSPQNCVAVGPYDEFDQVEDLREAIVAQGGEAEVIEEEVAGRPDYLVYIRTTGSRVVARRIREELKVQEIDSHIIAGGDLQDALSVGVFSREPFARAQYDRVIGLGYEAAVRDLPRFQTVYHLMTDRPAAVPDAPGRTACHEIASANHFL